MSQTIISFDLHRMAADLETIATRVRRGDFIAIGVVLCDQEGNEDLLHITNADNATPKLIDAMTNDLKNSMMESIVESDE
jgi:hypothetical protein